MNRYSLIFALLVASSFAVHPTQTGESGSSSGPSTLSSAQKKSHDGAKSLPIKGSHGTKADDSSAIRKPLTADATEVIQDFFAKAKDGSDPAKNIQILFATVPHPVETRLGSAFDHNLDALQDGLQEAGYLFDNSWIPWSVHHAREDLGDDEEEKDAQKEEDRTPGILLFRKNDPTDSTQDAYAHGILVFLISEKPTEGIEFSQVTTAKGIITGNAMALPDPIQILGPTYSGSFSSMFNMVKTLHDLNPGAQIRMRTGSITGDVAATNAAQKIAEELKVQVDFGSTQHAYLDWIAASEAALQLIGINTKHTAILSEGESLYGGLAGCPTGERCDGDPPWKLGFPRDISSLRAGYEKQGIFNPETSVQPWKRFLNLKSDDQNSGDTIPSFGGVDSTATQEAILFGISDFLKSHNTHAAIIVATNEEDRLFLTQFLHANNAGVRVVVIGTTRIFMRGSTAQFRGDMMVDDFPFLPGLHEWTGSQNDRVAHVFADGVSEGTYFAAIDLFAKPEKKSQLYKWYPEYSEPEWDGITRNGQWPPMYVVALGGDATWPLWLEPDTQFRKASSSGDPNQFQVQMPFTLFADDGTVKREDPGPAQQIGVGRAWGMLFVAVTSITALYCVCFFYAYPVSKVVFASFAPSPEWRYWLFKVTIPAAVAGSAFWIMAWAIQMPWSASPWSVICWHISAALTILAPLAIAASAIVKALVTAHLGVSHRTSQQQGSYPNPPVAKSRGEIWMTLSLLPAAVAVVFIVPRIFNSDPFATLNAGSILNSYREMHWESGLSLLPTGIIFLFAIAVWASKAANGAALLDHAGPFPENAVNARISVVRARTIRVLGRPLPRFGDARSLWIVWGAVGGSILVAHGFFSPYQEITTLDARFTAHVALWSSGTIVILALSDLAHFLWLWDSLHGLLEALNREEFKRSFVPIADFKWRNLWSFTGISLQDRRAIDAAQGECVQKLAKESPRWEFQFCADKLPALYKSYRKFPLPFVCPSDFERDRTEFVQLVSAAASTAMSLVGAERYEPSPTTISAGTEAIQRALFAQAKGDGGRFGDEAEDVARLPEWQQTAERLVCLVYIGFIQTIVARLHTLLISVASLFSLVTLGVAIYPFVPFFPLLMSGVALLLVIGWAFFKVFYEMDTDPILSRIVNGDDRKLQGNFYMKFAEAMALPLLTVGSSLLPGGAGRLLELVQSLLNHAQ